MFSSLPIHTTTLRGLIFAGTYFRETIFSRNNLIFAGLIFANLPVFYRISFIFLGLLGKKPYISRIKRFLKFSRGLIFANLRKNSRTSRNIIPAKINPLKVIQTILYIDHTLSNSNDFFINHARSMVSRIDRLSKFLSRTE